MVRGPWRALVVLVLAGTPAIVVRAASPVFHGRLDIRSSSGPIASDGTARLSIRPWTLHLGSSSDGRASNGVDPLTEPIIFAIGEQRFLIPAGTLRASRTGTRFRYVSHDGNPIRSFRVWRRPGGSYAVRFSIGAIELSALNGDVTLCRPAAVIIGDDDGFIGLLLVRKTLTAPRFRVRGTCDVTNDWPWIQG